MASFAPVYRLSSSQRSILSRERQRGRKRKRGQDADHDDDDDDDDEKSEAEAEDGSPKSDDEQPDKAEQPPRVLHPVNQKDPYNVAGWSREIPLPGRNFPHAAFSETVVEKRNVEEDLAQLNPPIYLLKKSPDDPAGSLRGRHLDNLTAILHRCMLRQDWKRATRAWGLILRTEIAGDGPDIRKHGRWMIGAELLMRKGQTYENSVAGSDDSESHRSVVIPDSNFQLAREYYGRLVLQHPQLQGTHYSRISAWAIYPTLLNIWIFEVQERSRRARQQLVASLDSVEAVEYSDVHSERSDNSEHQQALCQIRSRELQEASPIVQKLEELLSNPPYDTSAELLELRGMVSLWLADLHKALARMKDDSHVEKEDEDDEPGESQPFQIRHQMQAQMEHAKAKETFQKAMNSGANLSLENLAFLEGESSRLDDVEDE